MIKAYIYMIECTINNKKYIGSTIQPYKKRIQEHFSRLRNNKHANRHLQNSWNKYGEENFTYYLLETCKEEDRIFFEDHYINKYKTLSREFGYNLAYADMVKGHVEEVRKRISEGVSGERHWNYGNNFSEETIKRMSDSRKGEKHWNYGKNTSDDVKDKISKGNKGKHVGEKNSSDKLKDYQVLEILELLKTGMSQVNIAKIYGVHQIQISSIKLGKTWGHVTGIKRKI